MKGIFRKAVLTSLLATLSVNADIGWNKLIFDNFDNNDDGVWTLNGATIGNDGATGHTSLLMESAHTANTAEGKVSYNCVGGETINVSWVGRRSISYPANKGNYNIIVELAYWDASTLTSFATPLTATTNDEQFTQSFSIPASGAHVGKELAVKFSRPGGWGASLDNLYVAVAPIPTVDNSALAVDGIDDYVTIGNIGSLDLEAGMSIEAWIKPTAISGAQAVYGDALSTGIWFGLNGDKIRFSDRYKAHYGGTTSIVAGEWTHIAVTRTAITANASTIKLFVNGTLEDTITGTSTPNAHSGNSHIGAYNNGGEKFTGMIDDVRIWNITRTDADITNNKDADLVGNEAGLVALYEFEANLFDATSNFNVGTPVNLDWSGLTSNIVAIIDIVKPYGLVASNLTDISFNFGWNAVTDADAYKVEVATDASFTNLVTGYPKEVTTLTEAVTGLTASTTYYYGVSTKDGNSYSDRTSASVTTYLNSDGMLHQWELDENAGATAPDSTGTADGTLEGDVSWDSNGKIGGAVSFTGIGANQGGINLGTAPAIIGTGDFSWSAWFKTTLTDTDAHVIIGQRDGSHWNGSCLLRYVNGNIELWTYTDGASSSITSGVTVNDGTWHNVVAVRKADPAVPGNSFIEIYIDGVLANTPVSAVTRSLAARTVGLGKEYRDNGGHFNGAIDDVKIYERALSTDDVNQIITPVVGLEVVQSGTELTWTVEEEIGVKQYTVISGDETIIVMADGSGSYSITLDSDAPAKLIVVDKSGFTQTFYPEDGDIKTVAYNLSEGWNLITVTTENADLTELTKVCGDLWIWAGDAYQLTTDPQPTQGVWVYAPKDVELTVSGNRSDAEMAITTGWNLVGPVENSSVPVAATIVYSWNDIYESIATDQGVLLKGVGYWIFSF